MKKTTVTIVAVILILAMTVTLLTACDVSGGAGESAYEIAVRNGYIGTETEWLASLVGADGTDGANGTNGADGEDGASTYRGYSAYEIAVQNGYIGTEADWLDSLKGERGETSTTDVSEATNTAILSCVSVYCQFTVSSGRFGTTSTSSAAGSGIIYGGDKSEGTAYIITNYHVVYNSNSTATNKIAETIKIYLYGMEYSESAIVATYVGGSMTYDVALLKIDSDTYRDSASVAATVGTSSKVTAGDSVIAIGNPDAEGISATFGIISVDSEYIEMTAADDKTTVSFRVMRIDAAVNSGNSGGGLFDNQGKLVGILNAKTVSSSVENIAYALPVDNVMAVVGNIIRNCEGKDNESVLRCVIGITVQPISSYAYYSNSDKKTYVRETMEVVEVTSGSAADGIILADDVILGYSYDGGSYVELTRNYQLIDACLTFEKDKTLVLSIKRGTETLQKTITLSNVSTIA